MVDVLCELVDVGFFFFFLRFGASSAALLLRFTSRVAGDASSANVYQANKRNSIQHWMRRN